MSECKAVIVEANKRMWAASTHPQAHGNRSPAAQDALNSTTSLETPARLQDCTEGAMMSSSLERHPISPPVDSRSNTFPITHTLYYRFLSLWFIHLFEGVCTGLCLLYHMSSPRHTDQCV